MFMGELWQTATAPHNYTCLTFADNLHILTVPRWYLFTSEGEDDMCAQVHIAHIQLIIVHNASDDP